MIDTTKENPKATMAKAFANDPRVAVDKEGRVCPHRCDVCRAYGRPPMPLASWVASLPLTLPDDILAGLWMKELTEAGQEAHFLAESGEIIIANLSLLQAIDLFSRYGDCRKSAGRPSPVHRMKLYPELKLGSADWCDMGEIRGDLQPMTPEETAAWHARQEREQKAAARGWYYHKHPAEAAKVRAEARRRQAEANVEGKSAERPV